MFRKGGLVIRVEYIMKRALVLAPEKILRNVYKVEIEDEAFLVYLSQDDREAVSIPKKTPVNIPIT